MNKVSVIIPVYKSEKFVSECLISVLNQTYKNFEVIVVYDPSPDKTLEKLKEFKDKIELIIQDRKTNPATARNAGMAKATGAYVAFCDSDDFWSREKLAAQVKFLEQFPEIDLAYTDLVIIKNGVWNTAKCPEWSRKEWLKKSFICFSSIMLRNALLSDEKFDEKLAAFDDYDFLLSYSKHHRFSRIPVSLTFLRDHLERLSAQKRKMYWLRAKIEFKHRMMTKAMKSLSLWSYSAFRG